MLQRATTYGVLSLSPPNSPGRREPLLHVTHLAAEGLRLGMGCPPGCAGTGTMPAPPPHRASPTLLSGPLYAALKKDLRTEMPRLDNVRLPRSKDLACHPSASISTGCGEGRTLLMPADAAGGPSTTDTYMSGRLSTVGGLSSSQQVSHSSPARTVSALLGELCHPGPRQSPRPGTETKSRDWPARLSGPITATRPPPPSGRPERGAQTRGGVRG